MIDASSADSDGERYVVVVGDALIDELRLDGGAKEFVGGAALNVAVGLTKLGVRAKLIAMVGDDADGDTIRSFVASHGVELIATVGPYGSSRSISDRIDGEPSYEFNLAAQSRRIQFGRVEREAIASATLVVVSCFPFDDARQTNELAGSIANARDRLIIDPNPREGMIHDLTAFRASFDQLAAESLLIKVGDDDSALLYDSHLAELESHLLGLGCSAILGTAGRDGSGVVTASGITAREPIANLPGTIVDTMGAGDAVLASVTRSILADGVPRDETGWQQVLRRAMAIAAATCRREGALLRLP